MLVVNISHNNLIAATSFPLLIQPLKKEIKHNCGNWS